MSRTTLNIDDVVLRDVKRLQKRQKKPLGRLVSDLLLKALNEEAQKDSPPQKFQWLSRPMKARVDLEDKEAVWNILDRDKT